MNAIFKNISNSNENFTIHIGHCKFHTNIQLTITGYETTMHDI